MADYDFYVNQFKGHAIPEALFSGVAAQADAALARMKRIYRVEASAETAEAMAVCAMAEALYAAGKRSSGVSAAAVGSVSVRYESQDASRQGLAQELYRCARRYLDIYRGVG